MRIAYRFAALAAFFAGVLAALFAGGGASGLSAPLPFLAGAFAAFAGALAAFFAGVFAAFAGPRPRLAGAPVAGAEAVPSEPIESPVVGAARSMGVVTDASTTGGVFAPAVGMALGVGEPADPPFAPAFTGAALVLGRGTTPTMSKSADGAAPLPRHIPRPATPRGAMPRGAAGGAFKAAAALMA